MPPRAGFVRAVAARYGPRVVPPIALDRADAGVAVVAVSGEQDVGSAPLLRERIGSALAGRRPVVIDLTETDSIDSAILGVLLSGLRRAREQGSGFALVVPGDDASPVRRVLEITGLTVVFPTFSSRDPAIGAVRATAARR